MSTETKINLLRLAQRMIERQEQDFICHALVDAVCEHFEDGAWRDQAREDCFELRAWVMSMLGIYTTLEGWLWRKHGIDAFGLETASTLEVGKHPKARDARIRWIDWMISELKRTEA